MIFTALLPEGFALVNGENIVTASSPALEKDLKAAMKVPFKTWTQEGGVREWKPGQNGYAQARLKGMGATLISDGKPL